MGSARSVDFFDHSTFVVFCVTTGAWSEFMAAAAAAPDLDCLIAAHEKFLASVLHRALLGGGKAEALMDTLKALLINCRDLAGPVKQLKEKVNRQYQLCHTCE